ncbi:hypothetical protein HDU67_010226 [Dinochytrium kinnereticum]|nr:hypothetical protein HDU67_010226 [Dinochytrium kinnereticum]
MEEVKRILNRFDDLNLETSLDEMLSFMSPSTTGSKKAIKKASVGTGTFVLPPFELAGLILTRMVGAYALLDKLMNVLESSYSQFRALVGQTYFMPLALAAMGIMARQWILAKKMKSDLEAAFKSLRWNLQDFPVGVITKSVFKRLGNVLEVPDYALILPESIELSINVVNTGPLGKELRDDIGDITFDDPYADPYSSTIPIESSLKAADSTSFDPDNADSFPPISITTSKNDDSYGSSLPLDLNTKSDRSTEKEDDAIGLSDQFDVAEDFWKGIGERSTEQDKDTGNLRNVVVKKKRKVGQTAELDEISRSRKERIAAGYGISKNTALDSRKSGKSFVMDRVYSSFTDVHMQKGKSASKSVEGKPDSVITSSEGLKKKEKQASSNSSTINSAPNSSATAMPAVAFKSGNKRPAAAEDRHIDDVLGAVASTKPPVAKAGRTAAADTKKRMTAASGQASDKRVADEGAFDLDQLFARAGVEAKPSTIKKKRK